MSLPPLRALQIFTVLGRTGSVGKTALELGISSGAVSQQIKNLEQSLDLVLFERRARQLVLTHWGKLYYEEIAKSFLQIEQAGHILDRAQNQNKITLSALSSVVNKWLGTRVFDWQQKHPETNIRILGHEEEPRLGIDPVDFRLTYGEQVKKHQHYTTLFTDWVVPVCAPALIKQRLCQAPSDILTYPLIHLEWGKSYKPPPQWVDWARHIGKELRQPIFSLSFDLSSSAIEAALSGRGFCLAQISLIQDELTKGKLIIPFDIRLKLPESYFLAWDAASLEKPQARAFHSWLLHSAKKQKVF